MIPSEIRCNFLAQVEEEVIRFAAPCLQLKSNGARGVDVYKMLIVC